VRPDRRVEPVQVRDGVDLDRGADQRRLYGVDELVSVNLRHHPYRGGVSGQCVQLGASFGYVQVYVRPERCDAPDGVVELTFHPARTVAGCLVK
jgi:hypothetical protein